MGSIFDFLYPLCLCANRNKNKHKKRQQNGFKDEKKVQLLKNKQLTLQECILSSPSLHSPLPSASSSKRIYPSGSPPVVIENVSMETLLLGDSWNPLFEHDNNDETGGTKGMKKRVSFRIPEVADIFILTDSPESPPQQDLNF